MDTQIYSAQNPAPTKRARKPTILFIDDDQDQLVLFQAMLAQKGYDVVGANSAEDGLTKLRSLKIDLVITDIMMPQMDGCQFTYLLRKMTNLSKIPVIAVTAGTDDLEADALQHGADRFCSKNKAHFKLAGQIEELLSGTVKAAH